MATMGKKECSVASRAMPRIEVAKKWQAIIEYYTMLDLTFSLEKLPAISGLAKRMGKMRPGVRYFAGLWEDSMQVDLLWARRSWPAEDEGRLSRTAPIIEARAPSWSWACRDIAVDFPFGYGKYCGSDVRGAGKLC